MRVQHSVRFFASSGKERQNYRAFTLVELMVVMVLIGILTAMILPEMKGTFEEALLRSSSRKLLNAFRLAYSRAVSLNQEHRVRFESRTGHYWVEMKAREGATEFVSLPDVPEAQGAIDSRVSVRFHQLAEGLNESHSGEPRSSLPEERSAGVNRAAETLSFHPDGTADAGEIILRDRDGFRLALRVNPITARVRAFEIARE